MPSWKHADLMQLSGAPDVDGRPFAYVTHGGSNILTSVVLGGSNAVPRVLYRSQDAHIHELRLEGGSWKKADLMEQVGGAPGAGSLPFAYDGDTPRVVYRGQGGGINELRLEGESWKKGNLSQLAGAPGAQGAPSACVTHLEDRPVARVVYRADDGHIHEVRLEDGSWKKSDLSRQTGAPGAAGDPFVYETQSGSKHTVRVVYLGSDAHIQELHLDEGGSWEQADLSERAGAPDAASGPFAYAPDHVPRVIYRGTDAHIYELRLEGGSWKKGDLTELAGAANAQGQPTAYASGDSHPIPRVIYRSNGQIIELRLEGGSWKKADLTDLAGAPPAAGDPVGYVTPDGSDSTPRVLYRGGDGHIHELRLE